MVITWVGAVLYPYWLIMPTTMSRITEENTLTGNITLHRGTDLMERRLSDS